MERTTEAVMLASLQWNIIFFLCSNGFWLGWGEMVLAE